MRSESIQLCEYPFYGKSMVHLLTGSNIVINERLSERKEEGASRFSTGKLQGREKQ
jgi:hypothetical protein